MRKFGCSIFIYLETTSPYFNWSSPSWVWVHTSWGFGGDEILLETTLAVRKEICTYSYIAICVYMQVEVYPKQVWVALLVQYIYICGIIDQLVAWCVKVFIIFQIEIVLVIVLPQSQYFRTCSFNDSDSDMRKIRSSEMLQGEQQHAWTISDMILFL